MANTPTKLTVTVSPDGSSSTDFFNFTGSACLDAGRLLHTLLSEYGIETEVTAFTPKPELGAAPAPMVVSQADILQEGGR